MLDVMHHLSNLIQSSPVRFRPRTPLIPVNMSQITVLVGPFVLDAHPVIMQILHVRVTVQEPQQLVYNGF